MNRKNQAFTLIELLVVIAIIAILAAILFPVFAQAKAAAKAAVSISNQKQIALANIMYSADYDDTRVARNRQDIVYDSMGNFVAVVNEYNWKQLTSPYVKSLDMYSDPSNRASKFLDIHSDAPSRAFFAWTPATPPSNLIFHRGYAIANDFCSGTASFSDNKGCNMTTFPQVAQTLDVMESKDFFEDMGPYVGWNADVDASTSWLPTTPHTGLTFNWTSDKYGNKAQSVSFLDGHAKRLAFTTMCGLQKSLVPGDGRRSYFNWAPGEGFDWATGACDDFDNPARTDLAPFH